MSDNTGALVAIQVFEVDIRTDQRSLRGRSDDLREAVRLACQMVGGEAPIFRYRMGPDTLFLREGSSVGAILVVPPGPYRGEE